MNTYQVLLLALFLVSGALSLLYSRLSPEKAKRLNSWYHILGPNRENFDLDLTAERTKFTYYLLTALSLLGLLVLFINENLGNIFFWITIIFLGLSSYFRYPVKTNKKED